MMIKKTSTLLLILLCSTLISKAQDPNFLIFLAFGQSNMEGAGTIESQDRTVDSRFKVFQSVDCSNLNRTKNEWYPAIPPSCRCWSGLSPVDYFGRTLVENLPEHIKIGIINVSVGGCRIELFDKDIYQNFTNTFTEDWFQDIIKSYDGNPYQHLVDLAKKAQKDGVIKGILLHQGESNNGDSQWPNKVKKIYDDLITDLSLNPEDIPLLAGELVHADQGGALAGMNSIIAQLPATLPNSYVISSSECTDKDDNIHFNSAGYRDLGRRYGEKMMTLLEYNSELILAEQLPLESGLFQNHPNPAIVSTNIPFQLAKEGIVTLELLDLSGKTIRGIASGHYPEGRHVVEFDVSEIPSGIYFYKLLTTQAIQIKKIIIQ